MTTHELKCWPEYFQPIIEGRKKFEVRKNDRDFQPNDRLHLKEYDPRSGAYSGREYSCDVHYVLSGPQHGIEEGYVVMSLDNSPF